MPVTSTAVEPKLIRTPKIGTGTAPSAAPMSRPMARVRMSDSCDDRIT